MAKTTLYLPDDLMRAIELEAARSSRSEAEVVRSSLRDALLRERPRPQGALFFGREPIADVPFSSGLVLGATATLLAMSLLCMWFVSISRYAPAKTDSQTFEDTPAVF